MWIKHSFLWKTFRIGWQLKVSLIAYMMQNCKPSWSCKLHSYQEEFWREKARVYCFTDGDRNTSYFHRLARIRCTSKRMYVLKSGDQFLDKQEDIENHVVHYFSSLYASENSCAENDLVDKVIPSLVTFEDNAMLTNIPTLEEVKGALFTMNVAGAPGPDGFGGIFYQKFWHIVGVDVYNSILEFFTKGWMLPNLNSNLVVLIPKFNGAYRIEDYMPIALADFQFKIITKVLADRLSSIATKIISNQQRGFIKDRQIAYYICITSEAVNILDHKAYGGNLALTFDIKKFFDTIDWNIIFKVLNAFGFNVVFCNWVRLILISAKLSFYVNGQSIGFFACKRGVR